jgi:hypothetical protein
MERFFSLRLLCVAAVVASVVTFGGCAKKQDTVAGPDPLPTTGGSISVEVRTAALDTLTGFINKLQGLDPAADRVKVLAYLKTRPEFEASGLSPDGGNVWARFVDGVMYLYMNDRKPGSGTGTLRYGDPSPMLRKNTDAFPGASKARIMNALGSAFPDAKRTVDLLRPWCTQAGYTLSTPNDPSIDNLMTMSGDGIFYWAAHGGTGWDRRNVTNPMFAMWTTDVVTPASTAKYQALLDSGEVVIGQATNDWVGGSYVSASHFMVTLKFIGNHMSFAKNSLVYFDACSSGGFDASYQPLLKSAGFYLGWSQPVADDSAARTALYFFDRALGLNIQTPKLTPPQRPFYVGDLLSDMRKQKMDESGPTCRLVHPMEPVLTTLRLLAPSIGMAISDVTLASNTFTIAGDFADDPGNDGAVLLNNNPMTISNWTPTSITVQKPATGGTMLVTVRNVKSNPVNLTEWHETFDYTYTGDGTLKQHIVVSLGFVADVHSYYGAIFGSSQYMPYGLGRVVQWLKTCSCTYDCSGESRDPKTNELLEQWSGGASLPMVEIGSTGTGFSAYAMIDSAGARSTFLLNVSGTYTRWTKSSGANTPQPLTFTTPSFEVKHSVPGFVITGGSVSSGNGTLKWQNSTTTFPPDPNAAQ